MSEHRFGWAALGLGLVLAAPAAAEDEWAILGHELGCWRVKTAIKALAEDVPSLAKLRPVASPDDLTRQLAALGVHAKQRKVEGQGGTHPSGIVIVEIDSEHSLAFVKRRDCTEFND